MTKYYKKRRVLLERDISQEAWNQEHYDNNKTRRPPPTPNSVDYEHCALLRKTKRRIIKLEEKKKLTHRRYFKKNCIRNVDDKGVYALYNRCISYKRLTKLFNDKRVINIIKIWYSQHRYVNHIEENFIRVYVNVNGHIFYARYSFWYSLKVK